MNTESEHPSQLPAPSSAASALQSPPVVPAKDSTGSQRASVSVKTGAAPTWLTALALVAAVIAAVMAWSARRDSDAMERELVMRQTEAQAQITAALTLAKSAEDSARDAQAKTALLDARTADASVQRTQLESMMSALTRTRDENALGEIEATLRAAMQQATWTGRSEPMVTALKQADERLATINGPRIATVRRALARDLDRINAAAAADGAVLAQRIDEVLRRLDELPLTMQVPAAPDSLRLSSAATHPEPSEVTELTWRDHASQLWLSFKQGVSDEARSLVRVSRIEQPQAMLLAPQQAYFLREGLRLRLLSARLAVLSRQGDVAQGDLREALRSLDSYFDRQSPRVVTASDTLKQVAAASRQSGVPRPDETLAALALLNP